MTEGTVEQNTRWGDYLREYQRTHPVEAPRAAVEPRAVPAAPSRTVQRQRKAMRRKR